MSSPPLWTLLRGCVCGSGLGALSDAFVAATLMQLLPTPAPSAPHVLYIGTATSDDAGAAAAQTARLREAGCVIAHLELSRAPPPRAVREAAIEAADIVVVSGGNSLYMLDTWRALGVDAALRRAVARGVVLGGGSAGLGWLFDGLHSDSADPTTFRLAAPPSGDWRYVRVPALGILPGLVTPHADQTQSNGVLRGADAEAMLRRHAGERLWAVDHWAALRMDGAGGFRVLALPGRERAGGGAPGIVVKDVRADGTIEARALPAEGRLADWLRCAEVIVEDPAVGAVREANPAVCVKEGAA